MNKQMKFTLSLVAIATLSACGGGGGDAAPASTPVAAEACPIVISDTTYGAALQTTPATCADFRTIGKLLEDRIKGLKEQITGLQELLKAAPTKESVAALNKQITDLQDQLAAAPTPAQVTALNKQITGLQELLAAAPTSLQIAALNEQVKMLSDEVTRLTNELKTAMDRILDLEKQLAAAPTPAQVTALNAEITRLTVALAAAPTQAALTALTAQVSDLQAALTAAPTPAQVALLNAQIVSLQAAVGTGGNTTGLPLCAASPNPIVASSTFAGAGTSCVVRYADQVALATAIAQAASAMKFEGVYSSSQVVMVAEVGGRVWTLDQAKPDSYVHSITSSNGSSFAASGMSLSFTHASAPMTGTYSQGTSASVTLDGTVFPLIYDAQPTIIATGVMGGQDFYSGSHDLRLTTAADGSFTGAEGTCKFTGNFLNQNGYKKVSITWGANCAVPDGTVGSGVMARYGDNFLMITNQVGAFSTDVAFVAFFNPTWTTGTAVPAGVPMTLRAKALQATLRANAK